MSGANKVKEITLDREQFKELVSRNINGIVVLKFGAEWCVPCKKSKGYIYERASHMPSNVVTYDIDVDESFDLYAWMKSKKQVNGIPALLAYYPGNASIGASHSISGSDENAIGAFFDEVERASLTI